MYPKSIQVLKKWHLNIICVWGARHIGISSGFFEFLPRWQHRPQNCFFSIKTVVKQVEAEVDKNIYAIYQLVKINYTYECLTVILHKHIQK